MTVRYAGVATWVVEVGLVFLVAAVLHDWVSSRRVELDSGYLIGVAAVPAGCLVLVDGRASR